MVKPTAIRSTARAAVVGIFLTVPVAGFGQAGPSQPQVIAGAQTAKISVGSRKLAGHVVGTVRVGEDGRVREVLVTESTVEPAFEPQINRVLQSARFVPAIDAAGKPVEASIEMKVELRASTGAEPKPVAAKPDPQINEKERERIRRMTCADFRWEWEWLDDAADSAAATEFMPRIAISSYAAQRAEAGDYVDSKVWKAAAKGLRAAAKRCEDTPQANFWQESFRPVMDEAVPK